MAEVVESFPPMEARFVGGKYSKYYDGKVWRLELGVDCPAKPASAYNSLKVDSQRRGLKIKVTTRSKENAIYVQAILD